MKPWFIPYAMYRWFMRLAHRHNWHHVRVSYPEGDTMRRCEWCGMTEVLKRDHLFGMKIITDPSLPRNSILITNLKIPQ